MSVWFHHLVEVFNHVSLEFFNSHSLPAAGGDTKGGQSPRQGDACPSALCTGRHSGRQESEAGEGTSTERRVESMPHGTKAKEAGAQMDRVGEGGRHSRGHSDDMGVTSQGSRNGQRSLHSKKEQPSYDAAPRRTGLPQVAGPHPHPRWASVPPT